MKNAPRPRSAITVLAIALVLVGTVGTAASTGAGIGPWQLGTTNRAKQTTALVSGAVLDKPTVKIRNKGGGEALALVTRPGSAPFKVNSQVKVNRLNADSLDGLDSTAFVQVPGAPLSALVVTTEETAVPDSAVTPLGTYIEVFDPSDMHWAANPSLLMAPRTGTYIVSATVTWAADADGWRSVELRAPDTRIVAQATGPSAGAAKPTVQTVSGIVHLDAQLGVRLQVSQSSGGGELGATMTAFEISYVGT